MRSILKLVFGLYILFNQPGLIWGADVDFNVTETIGQPLRLSFKGSTPTSDQCIWDPSSNEDKKIKLNPNTKPQNYDDTNNDTYRPNDIWTYVSYGPDCGIEVNRAVEVDHGLWEGFVTLSDSKKFFVYIRVPPKYVTMPAFPDGKLSIDVPEPGTVKVEVLCRSEGSRPAPTVQWFIDEELLSDESTSGMEEIDPDEKITINETLNYTPQPHHDGKMLRCVYTHEAAEGQTFEASVNITVRSKPAKESFVVTPPESLVAGDAATFEFKFHSNPEVEDLQFDFYDLDGPINMTVNASTLTRGDGSIVEGRYTISPVVKNGFEYTAKLTISEVKTEDGGQTNYLVATNRIGNTTFEFAYPAVEDAGLSKGAVAGIVIGVVLLIALIGGAAFFVVKKKKDKKKKKSRNIQQIKATATQPTPATRRNKIEGIENPEAEMEERAV